MVRISGARALVASVALVAIAAGCGSSGGGTTPGTTAASAAAASGQITVKQDAKLGSYLVGPDGKSLYLLTKDSAGTSTCVGDCLAKWPPLATGSGASVTAGAGVTGQVATIKRPDGSSQVAINGIPLYYFASDAAAGDTKGQGVGGVWFLVSPTGTPIGSSPSPSAATQTYNSEGY
jgi:predicted lipoprotein with Yx(FWY)xxD motif